MRQPHAAWISAGMPNDVLAGKITASNRSNDAMDADLLAFQLHLRVPVFVMPSKPFIAWRILSGHFGVVLIAVTNALVERVFLAAGER